MTQPPPAHDAPALRATESVVRDVIAGRASFEAGLDAVLAYQRAHNAPLADWWARRGFDGDASDWRAIPGVPTDVFRHVRLVSSEAPTTRVYRTSGTTHGARGAHHRISTACYDAGAIVHFARCLVDHAPFERLVALTFDPSDAPDSSLAHMVGLFADTWTPSATTYHLTPSDVDVASAIDALRSTTAPTCVFGTAFAFVHLLDALDGDIALPAGSTIVETGGFKGRSRVVERDTLYADLVARLGVPRSHVLSEYSMTELSSQLYAASLIDHAASTPGDPHRLIAPPWCRVVAADPTTLAPLPDGERGLLRFVDLANVDSVVAIQTSDLGLVRDGAVWLEGRAPGATPRGCSLAIEEIVARLEDAP